MTPRAHHTAPGGTHVALPHMTLALLIGVPLALIVAYGFWMGGELGVGPAWLSRSRPRRATEDHWREPDSERRVPGAPYGKLER